MNASIISRSRLRWPSVERQRADQDRSARHPAYSGRRLARFSRRCLARLRITSGRCRYRRRRDARSRSHWLGCAWRLSPCRLCAPAPTRGGSEPLLGTNPIAVAIPAGDEPPVVLDIATSLASNGAIRTYELEGKPMPAGWVQHRKDGSPVTDPRRIEEGTYLPMGGYKGSGLSLVIGLLAGPLNRAAFGRDIRDFAAPASEKGNVGQFVVAFDVARFVLLDAFKAEVDRHIRDLISSHRLPGRDEIRVPGMGRAARRAERERNGVPLSASVLAQIDELAKSLDVATLSARA